MKFVTLDGVSAKTAMRVLSTILGVLLFSAALVAQGSFGRILGTVTDQTGAVLPGATVSVIDTQRGVARTLTTDAAGEYNAPNLIPGTYTIRVEAKGFQRLDRQNVVLEVSKEVRVDLTPQPGEQTQTVTVTEAIPLVDAASSTLGGTLDNAAINDMPLNGRNYQNLLSLRPGVMVQPGGSPWTQSTNNIRPDESVWMLDGVINVEFANQRPIASMPGPFTDGAMILPIDAIQEFNLSENPKAESGWKPGAVVNVGIKSGTNAYHGSAYAFGRDGDWDARNVFNPAPAAALPTELKQYGGVVGGPIKKDKLFFFGGYEALRSFVGNALGTAVPATGAYPTPDPANSMVDAIHALQAAGVTPNPISLQLLGCPTAPAGNFTCTGGLIQGAHLNTTTYNSGFPNTNTSDNGVGKIDYNLNSKNRINGLVMIGRYLGIGEDHPIVASYWESPDPISANTIGASWIWTPTSSLVNEARFGYNLVDFLLAGAEDSNKFANGKDFPLNTGITTTGGFPNVEITGFAPLGGWRGRPFGFTTPYSDIQDNLSYLRGKHSFKFGAEFAHIDVDFFANDHRGRIQFRGNQAFPGSTPLEDYFAGDPNRAFTLVGEGARTINWKSYAGFAQDDWRIQPRLMINLGLRYSFVSPLHEANNLWGNFDPTLGLVQQGQPSVGNTIVKPDYGNFSPRAGFAWDVTGKGTTIVRGGSSMMYSTYSTAQFMQAGQQNFGGGGGLQAIPTGACTTSVPVGTPCPQTFGGTELQGVGTIPSQNLNWSVDGKTPVFTASAGLACTPKLPCNLITVDPNLRTPYIVNYNLGVQHAFTNDLSLEVGYVGNHGDNLTNFVDLNQLDPVTGVRPYGAKFPYLKYINRTTNDGISNYNSLQTTLTKRLSQGLDFTAGYTYGHGLDNGSLSRFGNLPQNSLNPQAEYASGDFDIRHRFTLTAGYAIPGKKGFGQLLEGWKVNSIVTFQTGQPWLVTDGTNDFSGTGESADRWNFFGNPADFQSGSQSLPYCSGFVPGQGINGVTCASQSGISGIITNLPSSLASKCLAVAPDMNTLAQGGCFVKGNSVMVPPKQGTYGTMGRNTVRDGGYKNVDFSLFKDFKLKERYTAQFRWELFNVFNHPNIANPYGASNGSGLGIDPSSPTTFGCGCATPDVAAGNPLVGSGSARVMQIGLKLTF